MLINVNNFLNLKGSIQVLEQSYRVPQHAHYLAGTLIKRVSKRREKYWNAQPEEGKEKTAKTSDDKAKAAPSDKGKDTKSSDDKGKSANKEKDTKKK